TRTLSIAALLIGLNLACCLSLASAAENSESVFQDHLKRARDLNLHHQYNKALAEIDRALLVHPHDRRALPARLTLLLTLRRWREAQECAGKYIRENPKEALGYFQRGCAYMRDCLPERAIRDFDSGLAIEKNGLIYFNRASCNVQIGRYDDAVNDY